jgi:cytochrome b pre-mRNA-processing protein 3
MKWPFNCFGTPERTISALYGAIVAQARAADFYQSYQVPDTVNGRCDMIMLHVFLFFRRMNQDDAGRRRAVGQAVFDRFCQDMDDNLREMGIGDLKVPKQMLKIGEAYYGRANAYEEAIAAPGDRALATALSRNVYQSETEISAEANRLARYVRLAIEHLQMQDAAVIAAGRISWPQSAVVSAAESMAGV